MAFKDIFKNKKFYIIAIILLTVAIIKILAIFIYTKDEPKVVPEKAREEVRGGLKEAAEAISVVTPRLSEALVEAAYTPPATNQVDTSNWQTYKSEIYEFEVKYPSEMQISDRVIGDIFIADIDEVEKLESDNEKESESDNLFWGGRGIAVEVINKTGNLLNFVEGQFGKEGVSYNKVLINGLSGLYVEDRSPDRFGAGVGYYYFLDGETKWYEISLDYFYNQKESNQLNETFKIIANSFKN